LSSFSALQRAEIAEIVVAQRVRYVPGS